MAKLRGLVSKMRPFIKAQHGNPFKLTSIIVPLLILCLVASMTAAQTFQWSIRSSGTLKYVGVGVYSDNGCTVQVTAITWGALTPGASVDNVVYVKNVGTSAGNLSMSYGDFAPADAAYYMKLTWNCSGYVLDPDAVACARLTLSVEPDITGVTDFGFGIVMEALA